MVGIKGTGMAAFAELLASAGASVTGSDVAERFYTDSMLRHAQVPFYEGFSVENLNSAGPVDLLIHSAAWDPDHHEELLEARSRGIPMMTYTQALGSYSRSQPSVGISGVHGKTTTTGLVAMLVGELGLAGSVLAGSALANTGGRATLIRGSKFFVAETCEYRRNFLDFRPVVIVITSVEPDHLDYFRDGADVEDAFVEYARLLPETGSLVYCLDDAGARSVAERVSRERPRLRQVAYGQTATGRYSIRDVEPAEGEITFRLGGTALKLHVPGTHNVLNTAAAVAAVDELQRYCGEPGVIDRDTVRSAIAGFRGTRRRSEVIGEAGGVLVMDDYGHHPTAIATTISGLRAFHPGRRIVLSFMSHTYTRTIALKDELAAALNLADELILHDIYASAREANPGNVDGTILLRAVQALGARVSYLPDLADAAPAIARRLHPGDLFVTMGAGNNWQLGPLVLELLEDGKA